MAKINIGYTTTQRDAQVWSNGDVISNLDTNKLELRTSGTWIDNPSTPSAPTPATMLSVSVNTSLVTNNVYSTDATSGTITHTLPTAIGKSGEIVYVTKTDASANTVIVGCTGGQTINGDATMILTRREVYVGFQSNGTNWILN